MCAGLKLAVALLAVAAVSASNIDTESVAEVVAEAKATAKLSAESTVEQLMTQSVYGAAPCATVDIPGFDYAKGFAEYCKKFGKKYKANTHKLRFAAWKASHNCVEYNNANHPTGNYYLRVNHLHDHTAEEFAKLLGNREVKPPGHGPSAAFRFGQRVNTKTDAMIAASAEMIADAKQQYLFGTTNVDIKSGKSFSWLDYGAVTPVGDQVPCGDCWAWTAKAVAEGAWKIAGNNLQRVSAQQITDCTDGTGGCSGGNFGIALDDFTSKEGTNFKTALCLESDYPFRGQVGTCKRTCRTAVRLTEVVSDYAMATESDLFAKLQSGPVGISIAAANPSFKSYGGGVYDDPFCNQFRTNHAMTVVGYGTDPHGKGDYWLLKNSWAQTWGEKGYMRLARGRNMCYMNTQWTTALSAPASTFGIVDTPTVAPNPNLPAGTPFGVCYDPKDTNIRGICQDTQSCRDVGHVTVAGTCPAGLSANIQCCIAPPVVQCTVHDRNGSPVVGICKDTTECAAASRVSVPGVCDGPATMQCCLPRPGQN